MQHIYPQSTPLYIQSQTNQNSNVPHFLIFSSYTNGKTTPWAWPPPFIFLASPFTPIYNIYSIQEFSGHCCRLQLETKVVVQIFVHLHLEIILSNSSLALTHEQAATTNQFLFMLLLFTRAHVDNLKDHPTPGMYTDLDIQSIFNNFIAHSNENQTN